MKKLVIILIVVAIIALFPMTLRQKDGGTVQYVPITHIYSVTVYNRISENGRLKGTEISIFGYTVYKNTYTVSNS